MSDSVYSSIPEDSRRRRDFGSLCYFIPHTKGWFIVKQLLSLLVCIGVVIGISSIVGCGDDKKPAADSAKKADKKEDKKEDKKAP